MSAHEGVRGSGSQGPARGGSPENGAKADGHRLAAPGDGHPDQVPPLGKPQAAADGQAEAAPRNGKPQAAADGQAEAASRNGKPRAAADGQAEAASRNGKPQAASGGDRPEKADSPGSGAPGRNPRTRLIAAGIAVAAMLVGAGVYTLVQGGGQQSASQLPANQVTLPGPFRVTSVTPTPGTQQADGSQPIEVSFSAPVSRRSPLPRLTPGIAGHWQRSGNMLIFTPAQPISPSTQVTVQVPGGKSGDRSAAGPALASATTVQFSTGSYTTARLDELLSQLGYLPMTWHESPLGMRSANPEEASSSASPATLAGEEAAAYDPPSGTFTLQPGYPASLAGLFEPDSDNVMVRGAVMAFQSQNNMALTGDVTPALWNALFRDAITGKSNTSGYTYAVANQVDPETLTIWHNGQVVLTSPANTGIPVSPTVNGTFPVYLKYLNQIMTGTNPDGSHYADPVSYVSYFNGGDAVHYFPRGSFGYQQSLGCVELPYSAAQQSYPYLTLGSLVTVTG